MNVDDSFLVATVENGGGKERSAAAVPRTSDQCNPHQLEIEFDATRTKYCLPHILAYEA